MFYTSLESMKARYKKHSREMKVNLTSSKDFLLWQVEARKKLRELLALDKIESALANPVMIESTLLEGDIIREKWVMYTQELVQMPFYVLIPKGSNHQTPQYICAPGHLGGGKESLVGNRENPKIASMIDHYGYDYALEIAKHGCVAYAFDPRGFFERRENDEQADELVLKSSCYCLSHMAESLGLTLAGLLVSDIISLVNLIIEWDRWGEIRALGFSGGGLQVLYASAIDERIKCSFISGYFYGFEESLLELSNNCSCNYIPSLWLYFDIQDIASLITPRPLVIQSAKDDHLAGKNGLKNVLTPLEELKKSYALLSSSDKIYHHIVEGPHHFEKNGFWEALEKVCSN